MPRITTNAIALAQNVSRTKPIQAKKHRPHIPSAKIVRIERRHLEGESNREIARAEHCGRNTVAKIVKAPELQEHLQRIRERIWGMADHAADVVFEAIVQNRRKDFIRTATRHRSASAGFTNCATACPIGDDARRTG